MEEASKQHPRTMAFFRTINFSEPLPTGAYIAAGFALFVLTFIVNALARAVAGGKVNA